MPINYQIAADVVDIQTDTPKKDDKFFIDTNVWFWMTYTQASNSARHYQITNYPSYVNSILDAGGSVYQNGLSFAELAHLIEKTELDIALGPLLRLNSALPMWVGLGSAHQIRM